MCIRDSFSVLRVYVSPDGKPASFSKENVPYRPKTWLKVASKGIAEGDVVMIAGYPGRTQRYLTPSAVANQEKWFYPLRSKTFSDLIAILETEGRKDPDTALRVASAIKSYGNGETNARGQVEGLVHTNKLRGLGEQNQRSRRVPARLGATDCVSEGDEVGDVEPTVLNRRVVL